MLSTHQQNQDVVFSMVGRAMTTMQGWTLVELLLFLGKNGTALPFLRFLCLVLATTDIFPPVVSFSPYPSVQHGDFSIKGYAVPLV